MNNDDPLKPVEQFPSRTEAMLQEFFRREMPLALDSEIPAFRRRSQSDHMRPAAARGVAVSNRSSQRAVVVLLSLMTCAVLAFVVSGLPGDAGDDVKPSTNVVVEETGSQMGGMPVSSGSPSTDDESGIANPEHVEIDYPPAESSQPNNR